MFEKGKGTWHWHLLVVAPFHVLLQHQVRVSGDPVSAEGYQRPGVEISVVPLSEDGGEVYCLHVDQFDAGRLLNIRFSETIAVFRIFPFEKISLPC